MEKKSTSFYMHDAGQGIAREKSFAKTAIPKKALFVTTFGEKSGLRANLRSLRHTINGLLRVAPTSPPPSASLGFALGRRPQVLRGASTT